ncbi:hypothetical protein BJF78_23200 [Pseudonocardia sp. CNS-139]|nr:hypothetical protein BJF78_23200 [Pseudonocardia sp. CNS-139]
MFTCAHHTDEVIAARPLLDRDRAELTRRRDRATSVRAGHRHPPVEPLRVGTAALRLVEDARAWAAKHPAVEPEPRAAQGSLYREDPTSDEDCGPPTRRK